MLETTWRRYRTQTEGFTECLGGRDISLDIKNFQRHCSRKRQQDTLSTETSPSMALQRKINKGFSIFKLKRKRKKRNKKTKVINQVLAIITLVVTAKLGFE